MIYRYFAVVASLVCLLVGAVAASSAQSLGSGTLEGTVTDAGLQGVNGARVVVSDDLTGLTLVRETPFSGRFEFSFLPPGQYTLLVEHLTYQPVRLLHVPVRPGETQRVSIPLTATDAPAVRVDTLEFRGNLFGGVGNALDSRFSRALLSSFPERDRELSDLTRFNSSAQVDQGLPGGMSGIRIDGAPVGVRGPTSDAGGFRASAFPLDAFSQVRLVASNPDVEWTGSAAGEVGGYTRRGSRDFQVQAFGSLGDHLNGGGSSVASAANPVQGAVLMSGPLVRDTAMFVVGLEASRLSMPLRRSWMAMPLADQVLSFAGDALGTDRGDAGAATANSVSGFGNVDWRLSAKSLVSARGHFSTTSPVSSELLPTPLDFQSFDGNVFWLNLGLASYLSDGVAQELRLGVESSSRVLGGEDEGARARTWISGGGMELGAGYHDLRSYGQTTVRASEVLSLHSGPHRVKLGLTAALQSYNLGYSPFQEFYFAGLEELAEGRGYFVQQGGVRSEVSFQVPQAAVFAQDTWSPFPGMSLLLGARLDAGGIPLQDVQPNLEWTQQTGLSNVEFRPYWTRIQPRFGFTWDVQDRHEWLLTASAGMYSGSIEPAVLGELLTYDTGTRAKRGLGELGVWPRIPDSGLVPEVGTSLALAAPALAPPRTQRATLGISRGLGADAAVHLSALYRYTDLLPRRSDLNLQTESATTDQFGQRVFGDLRLQNGILAAAPGTNRRFADFDQVHAINVDGWSEYAGVTATLEQHLGERLQWFGTYTYSRTTDNVLWNTGSLPGHDLTPRPGDPEWMEGRSDLDVPHRLVGGAALSLPGGWSASVLYRTESGRPFTPGFRDGIDFNGDGTFRHDPAFVGPAVPGMAELLGSWSCLKPGSVAARNGCRADPVRALDARLSWRLKRGESYLAEFVLDGINLVSSDLVYPDRALYLVDGAGALVRAANVVTIPVTANPDFGKPLLRFENPRMLRLGVRIRY